MKTSEILDTLEAWLEDNVNMESVLRFDDGGDEPVTSADVLEALGAVRRQDQRLAKLEAYVRQVSLLEAPDSNREGHVRLVSVIDEACATLRI
jgi:hypothetical protein